MSDIDHSDLTPRLRMMADANMLVRKAGLTPEWRPGADKRFLRIRRFTDNKVAPLDGIAFPAVPERHPEQVLKALEQLVTTLENFDDA